MNKSVEIIESWFGNYSATVAQTRALASVEDGLKQSLRQILYANYTDGYTYNKQSSKAMKLMASGMRFYWHGDASLYENIVRPAKPFIMNYPLYQADSSIGNLTQNQNHAAARYVDMKLARITERLFYGIDKDTIEEWADNYDNTEKFPRLLPSMGFWGIVNGVVGIGVGISTSIPPFNLVEMNTALANMLQGKDWEIPMPDFPTGATIINKEETRQSLLNGTGRSCMMRATIEYDNDENSLIVTELPYLTFSDDIVRQINELILDKENDWGIDDVHDGTGLEPRIEIFLKKGVKKENVLETLYSKTSLQNFFPINMTMLYKASYPRLFNMETAMKAHLKHEKNQYVRAYTYDKNQLEKELNRIVALITITEYLEEAIQLIKSSRNKSEASEKLIDRFDFNKDQADAVLKMTLSRLTGLERDKLKDKKDSLEKELLEVISILENEDKLIQVMVDKLLEVAKEHGRPRRTKLENINEEKAKMVYVTHDGKATTVFNKNRSVVGSVVAGQKYIMVSKDGKAFITDEQPARLRKVFPSKQKEKVEIVYVAPYVEDGYLSFLTSDDTLIHIGSSILQDGINSITGNKEVKSARMAKTKTIKTML